MTDKDRIHRWLTQADLELMLDNEYRRGAKAMHKAVTQKISVMEDRWSNIILAYEAKGAEASDKTMVEHDCLRDVLDLIAQVTVPKDKP